MPDISHEELSGRWNTLRRLLREHVPGAGGLIVFSRLNIYHLTGTFGNGMLWLPMQGEPVLLCRRAMARARDESPITNIRQFKSYREVADILSDAGAPLTDTIAAEMNGLSWALSEMFLKYMSGRRIVSGDAAIGMARAHKSAFEIALMREAGRRHSQCLCQLMPRRMRPGMSEMQIARVLSDTFFEAGHYGILRMEKYGEEVYLGHVSSGDSGNHPSVFNGALGITGLHASVPHMGSGEKLWAERELMMIDNGFTFKGYQTDKSQLYWSGPESAIPDAARRAHDFCMSMQQWIAERLKPGAIPSQIWEHCKDWAARDGFGDGFMGLDDNKVHFVGHGIGLAIDEYPVLAKGFDLPLVEGMCIAVEPKMGVRGLGMVGVENTFVVTPGGGKSLTGSDCGILCVGG